MGREKSLTVEIDEATYGQLETIAQQNKTKLEDEVIEAVKTYIEHRIVYDSDPFFQIGKGGRSGLGDLSEAHDKYLYGYEKDKSK